jgi:putative membrane protein
MPMDWNGAGFGWLWMTLIMVVFWGAVIWGFVYLARGRRDRSDRPRAGDKSAIDVLEERFARGDIDDKEFRDRRDTLLKH